MAPTLSWSYEGRTHTTGAASSRCYRDLVEQRGSEAADRARDHAVVEMPRVRSLFRGGRGQQQFDVTVEAFLLAAGVPEVQVPKLARMYRSGAASSVDLSRYGRG